MKLYSWNVNGLRAALGKGLLEWMATVKPDVLCLQETKALPTDVPDEAKSPKGYESVWHSAEKKGYSGTMTYYKKRKAPTEVSALGVDEFDAEGRVQLLAFDGFTLINAYFPNSQPERARLDYKLRFFEAIEAACKRIAAGGGQVVLCGDYNVAHKEIDLARPKANVNNPGFYPEEREAMTRFLSNGMRDVFREAHPGEEGHYTWWSYRGGARAKNVGWRLDYHCVSTGLIERVKKPVIHPDIMGSDHCPVSLEVKVPGA